VCAEVDTTELLHLPSIPTNNVILCDDPSEALSWPVASFRLMLCRRCGFVFNSDFDPATVEYSSRIEETQAFSPHFVRYAKSLAADWIERYDIRGQTVLEIGCGKAEFLSLMCEIGGNQGIGFDPAVHVDRVDADTAQRLTLVAGLFGDEQMGLDADVLVCRHTLEHIAEVHGFLSMVHRWSTHRSDSPTLLFEVPDVERILDEVAFWDLFYEHCSYFTADSLRFAFERASFEIIDVRRTYDDQYLILEAHSRSGATPCPIKPTPDVASAIERSERFVERYQLTTARCRANLEQFKKDNKTVALWGGGSKAVSFITNLGVAQLVDFAVDVNPNKQGKFLVGTGHPVHAPEQLRDYSSLLLVVMNPAYMSEVKHIVEGLGIDAEITSVNDVLRDASAALG
jgi:hypothetical protein